MHKQRIYIDTSVIGGCFDEEFQEWSNKLFDEFIAGKKIAVISKVTSEELDSAPLNVQNKIKLIRLENIESLPETEEAEFLARKYIEAKAVSINYFEDALHIAYATCFNVDVLVSWNFRHIVNFERIKKYNSVNILYGYRLLEIRNPKEVIYHEEDI